MIVAARSEYGSFRDSLRAPIHRWFTYPAGYSYKFVEAKLDEHGLTKGATVGDPFLGTGTTSVTAKTLGVNSVGLEAHSFVHWVATTKIFFDHDLIKLSTAIAETVERAKALAQRVEWSDIWPPLVYKCFTDENLKALAALRQTIMELNTEANTRDFLKLALTATLRIVTTAGAGWPYIAPGKYHARKVTRDALAEFEAKCDAMIGDLQQLRRANIPASQHRVILGDAREFDSYVDEESLDLIVTSPPYLNNYDYADRTRLETYFWGIYDSWAQISQEVRERLVMAATTQVKIASMNGTRTCPGIRQADKRIHEELSKIIHELARMRSIKPGKKTYDYVVAGYFEDMLKVLTSARNTLKPGAKFVLVLGDSAPYGIHVPTEKLVGKLAIAVGFSGYQVEKLRTRGRKWGNNSQRHKVPLRESILTISK